jgi:cytochrome c oxidase subunit 2
MQSTLLASGIDATFWLPKAASTFAADHDALFYFIVLLCTFFFVLTMGVMFYFMWKYRRKVQGEPTANIHGNTKLEIAWSVVPSVFLLALFGWGFHGFLYMLTPPADAININLTGQQWSWSFVYPNGGSDAELVIPVGTPVKLTMTSVDVIHSFYVPAFRAKRDVVPGRYTVMWFQSDHEGEYDVLCTEYCGTSHSKMLTKVKVVPQEKYDEYLQGLGGCKDGQSLAECGQVVFGRSGCTACHGVEGNRIVGPPLNAVFGHEVEFADGSKLIADEQYIRESIMNPMAKIVKGYPGAMPTYAGRLNEEQMGAIVEYLRSMK